MLYIDANGYIDAVRITKKIFHSLHHGDMGHVNGIVVHQTGAATLQSTFNSYQHANANGAHFIIDKDGTIYQTASLFKMTYHVGRMKSRCLITQKCEPAKLKKSHSTGKRLAHQRNIRQGEAKAMARPLSGKHGCNWY
ncbi:peptidoglycan recognition protein family protein [Erwinia rhapontici]|uniref:peptidoglycan recognition protein family protein n=1 Tax=Erwinia rhapontici TaxID=55212 RepID=UPI00192DCDA1|nr:N-acetylmuramoyl-L-alanine amidase [Erwinia rhapontici]MBP2152670.1 hypothetical protein [Erwinia rhapontici]